MAYLPSIKKLQYLVKLYELQHFGKTAEACFVTQSTLSAGISDLEHKLGRVLIERDRQSMTFTATGIELVHQAKQILSAVNQFVETAEKTGVFFESKLRLGVIPTISPYIIPAYLDKLSVEYPKLKILVREDLTDNLLKLLSDGDLDLLIVGLPYLSNSVECLELYTDRLKLVYHKDSQFKDAISHAKLSNLPNNSILLLEDGHCLKEHTLSSCHLFDRQQISNFSTNSLASIVEMVRYDRGVSFIPDMTINHGILKGTGIVEHHSKLKEEAHREIGLAWRESTPFRKEFKALGKSLYELHLELELAS